jgi:hypothetical protein
MGRRLRPDWEKSHGSIGILVRRGHGEEIEAGLGKEPWKYWKFLSEEVMGRRLRQDWEKSHGSIGNSCEKRSWGGD